MDLRRNGSETGTLQMGVFDGQTCDVKTLFRTIDATTLPTSYASYSSGTGSHTIATGEVVGIKWDTGSGSEIKYASQNTEVYDGTNSYNMEMGSALTTRDAKFTINYAEVSDYTTNLSGSLDEFFVNSDALTQTEITNISTRGIDAWSILPNPNDYPLSQTELPDDSADETSTGYIVTSTATSNADATSGGTISTGVTGTDGNAWDFGGGKVTTSHQLLPTSGDWTYSTWINFDNIGGASNEILRSDGGNFEMWRNSAGLNVAQTGTDTFEAQSNLADNTWYNIVLVHSSSGDTIYLNGVAKTTNTFNTVPTETTWYLGGRANNSEPLDGQMDQTSVWSVALSASEVASLYSSTIPTTGLTTHYNFEQTGTTLENVAVTVNPITLTGEEIDFTDNEFLLHGFEIIQGTVPDISYDFSTTPTGWTEMDSSKIGIANDVLHYKSISDNSNDSAYIEVGDLGDDWTIRMKVESVSSSGGTGPISWFGLTSDDHGTGTNGYGNGPNSWWVDKHNIGVIYGDRYGGGAKTQPGFSALEAGSIINGPSNWSGSRTNFGAYGETVYLEMKLVGGYSGGTFSLATYTDDTYSTIYTAGANGGGPISLTTGNSVSSWSNTSSELTYLTFKNAGTAATGGTSHYTELNIDDIEIFIDNTNPTVTTTSLPDKSTNSVPITKIIGSPIPLLATTTGVTWDQTTKHGMTSSGDGTTSSAIQTTSTSWSGGIESVDTWDVGTEAELEWTCSGAHLNVGFGTDPFLISGSQIYNQQAMEYKLYCGTSGSEIFLHSIDSSGNSVMICDPNNINYGSCTNFGSWTSSTAFKMTMDTSGVVSFYKDGTFLVSSPDLAITGNEYYVHAGGTQSNGNAHNVMLSTTTYSPSLDNTSTTGTIGTALKDPNLTYTDADLPDNTDTFSLGGFVKLDTGTPTTHTQSLFNDWGGGAGVGKGTTGQYIATTSSVLYNQPIYEVSLWCYATGNPTGDFRIGVWNDGGLSSGGTDVGTLVHTFGIIDASTIAGTITVPEKLTATGSAYSPQVTDLIGYYQTSGFTDASNTINCGQRNTQVFDSSDSHLTEGFNSNTVFQTRDHTIEFKIESPPANTKLLGLNDVTFSVGTTTASVSKLVASVDPTGLQLYYDFNDGSTVTNKASSVFGSTDEASATDGNLNGGLTCGDTSKSGFGTMCDFDGSNDYIEVGVDNADVFDSQTGTIMWWHQHDTSTGNDKSMVSITPSGGWSAHELDFTINTDGLGKVRAQYIGSPGTSYLNSPSNALSVNGQWYHIAWTSDSSTTKLYIDGVPITLNAAAGSNLGNWSGDLNTTVDQLGIGGTIRNSAGNHVNGGMDELYIFNRALTETEIDDYIASSSPMVQSSIISATGLTANTSTPQHYAVTRDSSNGWTLYQNGVSQATATDSASLGSNLPTTTSGSVPSGSSYHQDFTSDSHSDGIIGNAYKQGVDSTISHSQQSACDNADWTSIMWYKSGSGTSTARDAIWRWTSGDLSAWFVLENNKIGVGVYGGNAGNVWNNQFSTADLGDGEWHQVAVVNTGSSQTYEMYVDGVADSTGTSNNSWMGNTCFKLDTIMKTSSSNNAYHLDEFSHYTSKLTEAEISASYVAGYDTLYTTNLSGSLDEFFINSDTLTTGEISDINQRGSTDATYTTTSTSYNDNTVIAGQAYMYKVYSVTGAGYSVASNSDSGQTVNAANAPAGVTATNGITQANVSWNASTDLGGGTTLAYKIYKNTNGGAYAIEAQPSGVATTFTDTNVTVGNTYGYKIVTVNEAGDSPQSNPATVIIGTVPDAPTLTLVTPIAGAQHTIDWTAPSNNGGFAVTGYEIERSTTPGSGFATIGQVGNVLTFTDPTTNLVLGDTYYYRILAINQQGTSGHSNEGSGLTGDKPDPVANVTADALVNYEINLNWTPANENFYAITGYEVFASENGATAISVGTTPQAQTQFLHQGLNSGSTYTYAVHATNSLGTSTISNTPNTIAGDIPGVPTNLTVAVVVPSQLDVAWGASSANGYTPTYTVAVSTDSGNNLGRNNSHRINSTNFISN